MCGLRPAYRQAGRKCQMLNAQYAKATARIIEKGMILRVSGTKEMPWTAKRFRIVS